MKVLLIHNYYGSEAPSGENAVYETERNLLRGRGYEVIEWTRHSDAVRGSGIGAIRGGASVPWNVFSYREIRKLIQNEAPDVMHVHNSFPLISPAVFHAAKGTDTATVLTLHNYRLFCAAAIPMRDGSPCTECLDQKSIAPALKYGCYRQSRLATVPLAMSIALHRRIKTWERHVDAFIALTEFQRDLVVEAGLPSETVHVKAHFYELPPEPVAWSERENKCVFIGRLSEEKGVHVLIDAWKYWGHDAPWLEIIGDGPDRSVLEAKVSEYALEDKVHFLGQLPFKEAQKVLGIARVLILPSLCFEGFPMVIREAFALGVPVAASRLGSMPCLVGSANGWLFEAGDADALVSVIQSDWEDEDLLASKAKAARKEFEDKYTSEASYQRLMEVYREAMDNRKLQA